MYDSIKTLVGSLPSKASPNSQQYWTHTNSYTALGVGLSAWS